MQVRPYSFTLPSQLTLSFFNQKCSSTCRRPIRRRIAPSRRVVPAASQKHTIPRRPFTRLQELARRYTCIVLYCTTALATLCCRQHSRLELRCPRMERQGLRRLKLTRWRDAAACHTSQTRLRAPAPEQGWKRALTQSRCVLIYSFTFL